MEKIPFYCNSLTQYSRLKTREVKIGKIPVGGNNPIRIQSMTTTDTMDTIATVEQTIRMVDSGCEYVRITAPSQKEAENLRKIKEELIKRGYDVPLIADIHFTPNAAEIAASIVEKVRINPGNYVDKKKFQQIEYTDAEYQEELDRIKERFSPLVKICKEHGTAMRIGTNHGSLSDRIMSRYGDTPLGMVESAMEFVRICEELDYLNLVLSMKASNTRVMVQAYRLLINHMAKENMNYPLHLGVTEAGDGEDGRVKSAVGIGALLEDGIGDTIRVSLTEEPENEAPVAIALAGRYKITSKINDITIVDTLPYNPFDYQRRTTRSLKNIGGTNVPVVIGDLSLLGEYSQNLLSAFGYHYLHNLDKWNIDDAAADYLFVGDSIPEFELPQNLGVICNYNIWNKLENPKGFYPYLSFDEYTTSKKVSDELNFIDLKFGDIRNIQNIDIGNVVFILSTDYSSVAEQRRIIIELMNKNIDSPTVIKRFYENTEPEKFRLDSSIDFGALLTDGLGDGVWAHVNFKKSSLLPPASVNRTLFGILQAARVRISKTEYIACPSCGRTLFDLVEVTNKIRSRTSHLKGLKIGIMGCIVNGPGEMADADYGYVGSGPGKITLYKEKEIVRRSIPSQNAVDELIELIKENGDWIEP